MNDQSKVFFFELNKVVSVVITRCIAIHTCLYILLIVCLVYARVCVFILVDLFIIRYDMWICSLRHTGLPGHPPRVYLLSTCYGV